MRPGRSKTSQHATPAGKYIYDRTTVRHDLTHPYKSSAGPKGPVLRGTINNRQHEDAHTRVDGMTGLKSDRYSALRGYVGGLLQARAMATGRCVRA